MTDRNPSRFDNVVPLHGTDLPRVPGPAEASIPARAAGPDDDELLGDLRSALEDLRREIRARLPVASGQSAEVREIDWIALFDELRGRVATLGMTDRVVDTDEFGMDAQTVTSAQGLLDFLHDRYFRVEVVDIAKLPARGPVLLVANRSGLLPYDGLMLSHIVARTAPQVCGTGPLARPRFMVADWLVTLPFVQPYLARLGGVRACRENADRLLRSGRSVVAFPEGVKGAAKSFRERYRLKRFGRGGVVRAAIENGVPLVPVGIVGAEEAHPILFKSHTPARMLGLPFLPVTPTFPLLGPLGLLPLPAKWIVTFGDPVDLPPRVGEDDEELSISRWTEELRVRIQQLVEEGLDRRVSVWS